ncbi:MAG: hypothetical protein HOH04_13875, partial [Rhodospirillaceae bacterium]|nr:hypothetical protein [Rhodospirillaceae bacterium]
YLDSRFGDGQLIPRDPENRARILTLAALAEGIKDALLLVTYEGRFREPVGAVLDAAEVREKRPR